MLQTSTVIHSLTHSVRLLTEKLTEMSADDCQLLILLLHRLVQRSEHCLRHLLSDAIRPNSSSVELRHKGHSFPSSVQI